MANISVRKEYKNKARVSSKHFQLLVQSISITGQLLLVLGKRQDARRIIMEFLHWSDIYKEEFLDEERVKNVFLIYNERDKY